MSIEPSSQSTFSLGGNVKYVLSFKEAKIPPNAQTLPTRPKIVI